MSATTPRFSIKEVAELLSVSHHTVRQWVREGLFTPGQNQGSRGVPIMFSRDDLENVVLVRTLVYDFGMRYRMAAMYAHRIMKRVNASEVEPGAAVAPLVGGSGPTVDVARVRRRVDSMVKGKGA